MTKVCTNCKESKEVSEYHKRTSVKNGLDSWCKSCKTVYRKDYFLRNQEKEVTRSRLKAWKNANIQLTMDEYLTACEKLQNHCEICGNNTQTLHVDHNHLTGKVRGFLCGSCNRALGLLKESPIVVEKALIYLKTHD